MLLLVLLATLQAPNAFRVHAGDDARYASRAFDDSSWPVMEMETVRETGPVWFRKPIDLRDVERKPGHPFAIYFTGLGSHEIFWDGVRIGGGDRIEAQYYLPDRLATPGVHTLAMRGVADRRGFVPKHGYWLLIVNDYDTLLAMRTRAAHVSLIALSAIVLTAVFAFAMFWIARRDRSFLLLGTLCLAAALMLIAEAWRPLFGYTYDWHIVRLRCIVALSWLVGVQLVALIVSRFPHRRARVVLLGAALASSAMAFFGSGWDTKSALIFIVCFHTALAWTLFAAARRMRGSVPALIGVSVVAIASWIPGFLDVWIYFGLDFLFICLLCSHAFEVRREQQEKSRLELEMVRRHLQPHFLMNTLTALSEWIEEEPRTAVRMIDALADELRILGTMSTQRVVTFADELRLCRSHLANMSLRKDVAYELEVDGVDVRRLVPPAVFHTLVENAITHGPQQERVTLRLAARDDRGRTRYVFESPLGDSRDETPGGGTRYIEARLREVWGSACTFTQGRADGVWRAVLEVPA
ncbi:MAG TPA: histidine kinase [Thermoanaerobaculia bacterium]|nr:histidine kinase [Thermoanaerobaculia bacterium]